MPSRRPMTVKSLVIGTTITLTLVACLYGFLVYRSLGGEFRTLGVR